MKDKVSSLKEKALAAKEKVKSGEAETGKQTKQEELLDKRVKAKSEKLR